VLILTRKPGEAIVIGRDVRVSILSVDGERVKIGIEAPREVPVVRQELLDAVRQSNLEAATAAASASTVAASLRHVLSQKAPATSHQEPPEGSRR